MANRGRVAGRVLAGVLSIAVIIGGCGEDKESPKPPTIRVTPNAVIRDIPYEINPPAQRLVVTNLGDGVLSYTARIGGGSSWLRLFGQISGNAPDSFLASISVGNLEAGIYYDTIWVESPLAVNAPFAVPVELTVNNLIETDPDSVVILTVSGDPNPEPLELIIKGASSAPFEYTLTETADWMTLSAYAGMAEDTIEVAVDIQPLEPGTYVDSIRIAAPIAEAPVTVACTLVVASWVRQGLESSYAIRGLHMIDADNGVAVGLLSAATVNGFIVKTTDGGANWEPVAFPDEGLGSVSFSDDLHGWAAGSRSRILHTVDGGDTWIPHPLLDTLIGLNTVFFVDAQHGWTGGSSGRLYRTVDGGANWQIAGTGTTSEVKGLFFFDAETGWMVGNSGLIRSTADSGKTWQGAPWPGDVDFWDVTFTDAGHGWIFGEFGTVLYTSNGGATWTEQSTPTAATLHGATFAGATRGWAVGDNGIILFTSNGQNWSQQPSGVTTSLFDVAFTDQNNGWICGDLGTLLHTTGGGL